MYFPKLNILKTNKLMNDFLIQKFDSWLASQSEMYYEYLNPIEFISECGINRKLGFSIFALSTSEELFRNKESSALLRIKYILDCPYCDNNIKTYYDRNDIPDYPLKCREENCDEFIPTDHPEKINIYFELLDEPIIDDTILKIYEKKPQPPLTLKEDPFEVIWRGEEGKINE